jgi:hygromycin-B 7''-O-kinase
MLEMPILPLISSFEEYEIFKQQIEVLEDAAKRIMRRHQLPDLPLVLFSEGTNIVFACGKNQVIKIFPPFHYNQYQSEQLILQKLENRLSVKTPKLYYHGEFSGWPYIIMSLLDGTILETLWDTIEPANKEIILRELGALIKEVHAIPTDGLEAIDSHW